MLLLPSHLLPCAFASTHLLICVIRVFCIFSQQRERERESKRASLPRLCLATSLPVSREYVVTGERKRKKRRKREGEGEEEEEEEERQIHLAPMQAAESFVFNCYWCVVSCSGECQGSLNAVTFTLMNFL